MRAWSSRGVLMILLLTIACVLACVPAPRVRITYEDTDVEIISRLGPILPTVMAAGQFAATAFFKANWPLVVDYRLETATAVVLQIRLEDGGTAPFLLEAPVGERQLEIFRLPKHVGKLQTGVIELTARSGEPLSPGAITLYGIGAGEKAVGSIAIEGPSFGPAAIDTSKGEEARYAFKLLSDFDRARALVYRVAAEQNQLVFEQLVERPKRDREIAGTWRGLDTDNEISLGAHLVQVHASRSKQRGGDWVSGLSVDLVEVR